MYLGFGAGGAKGDSCLIPLLLQPSHLTRHVIGLHKLRAQGSAEGMASRRTMSVEERT